MEHLRVRCKIELVHLVDDNVLSADREFNRRLPDRSPECSSTIHCINKIFNERGNVSKHVLQNTNNV